MLVNPKLRFMAVGVHPELNTYNTRKLEPLMEDPIIIMDGVDEDNKDNR